MKTGNEIIIDLEHVQMNVTRTEWTEAEAETQKDNLYIESGEEGEVFVLLQVHCGLF